MEEKYGLIRKADVYRREHMAGLEYAFVVELFDGFTVQVFVYSDAEVTVRDLMRGCDVEKLGDLRGKAVIVFIEKSMSKGIAPIKGLYERMRR